MLAALQESQKRQAPYAGAFLVKDEAESETEKNIYDFKGQELLNRLHEVGTLAQVPCSFSFIGVWHAKWASLTRYLLTVSCLYSSLYRLLASKESKLFLWDIVDFE